MSRPRAHSEAKQPHSVGLKVLRLTSPHFTFQYPLPHASTPNSRLPTFDSRAGLAYTTSPDTQDAIFTADNPYILSPVLTLPPAFGPAYVGETFACTLVASDEPAQSHAAPPDETIEVEGVKIIAEMQTPSAKEEPISLEPYAAPASDGNGEKPALTQRIVRHALLEEGTHVLAVTVTYNESRHSAAGEILGNRVRTFRKLYQFAAKALVVVSTKARRGPEGGSYILEAQLENVADANVVLEDVGVVAKPGLHVASMNPWGKDAGHGPPLSKGDVQQVCFLLSPAAGKQDLESDGDGVVLLGRLDLRWRNAMGERGRLATGWLSCKG